MEFLVHMFRTARASATIRLPKRFWIMIIDVTVTVLPAAKLVGCNEHDWDLKKLHFIDLYTDDMFV